MHHSEGFLGPGGPYWRSLIIAEGPILWAFVNSNGHGLLGICLTKYLDFLETVINGILSEHGLVQYHMDNIDNPHSSLVHFFHLLLVSLF